MARQATVKAKSIREVRRTELSTAAFEAVVLYGLRKTTLEKVGSIAGVSKGVVLHHFSDKSSLLEAVFRRSNTLLSESVIELYNATESPCERLWAIVVANFNATIFNRPMCQAWVSLLAEIPHNHQCQRIQTVCNARIHSNLRHELKHFLNEENTEKTARHLGLLIDGIWVRGGIGSGEITSSGAIDEMQYAIFKCLPNDKASIKQHVAAREKIEHVASILLESRAHASRLMIAR